MGLLTINGVTKPLSQWCKLYKRSYDLVYKRIKRGWTQNDAILLDPITLNQYDNTTLKGASNKRNKNNQYRKLYITWINIRQRTTNVRSCNILKSVNEGPLLAAEWMNFEKFAKWALEGGWTPKHYVKRYYKHIGYTPNNCYLSKNSSGD